MKLPGLLPILSAVLVLSVQALFLKISIDVSGLTTAGIIWLAAAVGMAIGFGEFYPGRYIYSCSIIYYFFKPVDQ